MCSAARLSTEFDLGLVVPEDAPRFTDKVFSRRVSPRCGELAERCAIAASRHLDTGLRQQRRVDAGSVVAILNCVCYISQSGMPPPAGGRAFFSGSSVVEIHLTNPPEKSGVSVSVPLDTRTRSRP